MLIEIHMLQNHSPSNLNRDDTGSPKECIFGGVKRGRISSQCLKRTIRRSAVFRQGINGLPLATRTRQLPDLVRTRLLEAGLSEELADIAAIKASGFGTKEGKEREDDLNTAQTMFLTDADVTAVVNVLLASAREAKTTKAFKHVETKELQKRPELAKWRPLTVDVALFGRMITSPAFQDVQGSIQVAHALSTNKIDHEFDYFTAVDDLQSAVADVDDKGADMIGDVEFNSATYYKYFSIDLAGLIANLAGQVPDAKARADIKAAYAKHAAEASSAAIDTINAVLKAAIFITPSGKQNTFAAHQLPDMVLVEVRNERTPISYANAFVKPARPSGDADLMDDSVAKFITHVDQLSHKFSLKPAGRLWFCTRPRKLGTNATNCDTIDDMMVELSKLMSKAGTHG